MAIPLSKKVINNRTIIPAAAFIIKPSCGRETQLKTCMGNVVNWSFGPSGMNCT
jgi:hypothetical protein